MDFGRRDFFADDKSCRRLRNRVGMDRTERLLQCRSTERR